MKLPKGITDFRLVTNGDGVYTTMITLDHDVMSPSKAEIWIKKNGKKYLEKQLHYKIRPNPLYKKK
ncbi:MAG: hypothetical protein HZC29_04235 [Thaumarchaeota archaeon]|nr:hypothetical protein [Nitrososphaerota archaeon]